MDYQDVNNDCNLEIKVSYFPLYSNIYTSTRTLEEIIKILTPTLFLVFKSIKIQLQHFSWCSDPSKYKCDVFKSMKFIMVDRSCLKSIFKVRMIYDDLSFDKFQ